MRRQVKGMTSSHGGGPAAAAPGPAGEGWGEAQALALWRRALGAIARRLVPRELDGAEREAAAAALAAVLAGHPPRLVRLEAGARAATWELFGRTIRLRALRPDRAEVAGPPLVVEELERLLAGGLKARGRSRRASGLPAGRAPQAPPAPGETARSRDAERGPAQTPRAPRDVRVVDCDGRPLRPTTRARAANDVAAGRAEWLGPDCIRLKYSPLADALVRARVRERDGGRCRWCGAWTRSTALLVPRARGGRVTMDNCVACCEACARAKGDLLPEEFARLTGFPVPRV